jgi:hypothetical protein
VRDRRHKPMKRRVGYLPERRRTLLLVQGQTEVGYFKGMGFNTAQLKAGNAMQTVREARLFVVSRHLEDAQIWVIVDVDDTPLEQWNAAWRMAKDLGFGFLFASEAFELWWILHFERILGPLSRTKYERLLQKYLPHYRAKEKGFLQGLRMARDLKPKLPVAMANAPLTLPKEGNLSDVWGRSATNMYELLDGITSQKSLK